MLVLLWHWVFVVAACVSVFSVGYLRRRGTASLASRPVRVGVVQRLTRAASLGADGVSRALTRRLRTGRPLRKRRRRAHARRIRFLAPAQLIDARPLVVEDRRRVGRTPEPVRNRHSRRPTQPYLRLVHLPDGHSAERCRRALEPVLASLPAPARQTLTWEGSEVAHHDRLAELFAGGNFFARPGSPWLRGTNENTNGLLRQYSPRAATSGPSLPTTSAMSSTDSTTAHARSLAGVHRLSVRCRRGRLTPSALRRSLDPPEPTRREGVSFHPPPTPTRAAGPTSERDLVSGPSGGTAAGRMGAWKIG